MRNVLFQPSVRFNVLNDLDHYLTPKASRKSSFREDETSYQAVFQLPGIKKDEVDIRVTDNVLSLRAKSKEDALVYVDFNRSYALPDEADVTEISASLSDGLLSVKIPKKEVLEPETHVIEVN